jgi:arsenate reductase-like glutaredoxin family protein
MLQQPDLLQRPIVEDGPRAILARPADRLEEFFVGSRG